MSTNPFVPPSTLVHVRKDGRFLVYPHRISGSYFMDPPRVNLKVLDVVPVTLEIAQCSGMDNVVLRHASLEYYLKRV